ncbi:hypothetical protein FACS1894153_3410 [Bacteroidia bacterium]|nr:hypothetical protein FACS1894153_3410 [Bacteroidia bacterium]
MSNVFDTKKGAITVDPSFGDNTTYKTSDADFDWMFYIINYSKPY